MRKTNLSLSLLLLAACAPEIAQDTQLTAVVARFDPSIGVIPTPNNVLFDPACTDPASCKLKVPIKATDPLAQREFNEYLNTLSGFPTSSTISLPMSGPISQATLSDVSVPVVDCGIPALPNPYAGCTTGALVPVVRTFDVAKNVINIRPAAGVWTASHTYVVLVVGGAGGLRGATGEMVVPDAAFYFLRGRDCPADRPKCADIDTPENADVLPGDTLAEKMETARTLQKIRAGIVEPAFQALRAPTAPVAGLARTDLAGLTAFTIARDVQPMLDLGAALLPLPNDLLIDPTTKLAKFPTKAEDPRLSDAEDLFRKYLNTMDGFLTSQDATVTFSGLLDAARMQSEAVSDLTQRSLVVFDLTAGAPVALDRFPTADPIPGAERWVLRAKAPAGRRTYWTAGHKYLVAVFGGPTGVIDSVAQPITAGPQFALLRGTGSLVDGAGKATVSNLSDSQAASLEPVRKALGGAIGLMLGVTGRDRSDLAMLWSFTITTRTQAGLDQTLGLTPFPTDAIRSPLTGRVVLPADACSDAGALCGSINQLDGFSTTGDVTIPFTAEVDLASAMAPGAIKLFALGATGLDTSAAGVPVYVVGSLKGMPGLGVPTLTLHPVVPLRAGTKYVGIVTKKVLDAAGKAIVASPTMTFLLSTDGLTDSTGKSKVSNISNAQAAALESVRPGVNQLVGLMGLAGQGAREDVALMWTFSTQTIGSTLVTERTTNYGATRGAATAAATELLDLPLSTLDGLGFPRSNIASLHQGTFKTWIHAADITPRIQSVSAPVEEISYLLAIPIDADTDGKNRVAIVIHGLQGEKTKVLAIADALAQQRIAMLAIDLPNHGERAVCELGTGLPSEGCVAVSGAATCDIANAPVYRIGAPMTNPIGAPGLRTGGACVCTGGACVLPSLNPVLRVASSFAWGIRLDNPMKIRDGLRQSALDVAQAVRLLRSGAIQAANTAHGNNAQLNPSWENGGATYYVGVSLGGLVGTVAGAIEPHLRSLALINAGGTVIDVLSTAPAYATIWGGFLAAVGVTSGSYKEFSLKRLFKWIVDAGDPLNFAPHLVTSPLPFDDHPTDPPGPAPSADKRVYLQMTWNDPTIPNDATFRIYDAMIPSATVREQRAVDDDLLFSPYTVLKTDNKPAHAFMFEGSLNTIGVQKRALAQQEMAAFLSRGN